MTLTRDRAALIEMLERQLAQQSLSDYALRMSPETYEQPPHVRMLIEHLEAVERGDIRRLMVHMPPRGSKSMHCSRLFPSWWLGKRPTDGVILASYGDTLATDNGRAVRDYVQHPRYPFAAQLRADAKAAGRWYTQQGGGLVAVGRGAGVTGWMLPGNLLVPDDLIKDREEAESETIRDSSWTWWQDTFMTRLAKTGAVVFPSTRWHEDDVSGRILNSVGASDWTVLTLPYVADVGDQLGRVPGETLTTYGYVPSVDKGEISAYAWSALYQQHPTPSGGGVFKKEWMQRRWCVGHAEGRACPYPDAKPLPAGMPRWRVSHSYDLGGKQGAGHDPSAIATWGTDGISRYVMDYWSSQAEFEDVKAEALARHYQYRPWMHYVEDATWAQPLISSLRRAGLKVYAVPPRGSKWTRADDVSGDFKGGLVVLPCSAPWIDAWIHEHLAFPTAAHDEAVDTTSLMLSQMQAAPQRPHTVTITTVGDAAKASPSERVKARLSSVRLARR